MSESPARRELELLRAWWWLPTLIVAVLVLGERLSLSSPEPHVLYFSHTFTAGAEKQILDDAVAEFQRLNPGVEIEQVVSSSEVYGDLGWRTQFQRRVQPDVYFQWDGYKVDTCVARGWALDLREHLSPEFREAFVPAALTSPGSDGIYLLPQSVDLCNLVWYDRDAFAKRGWKPPETLERWVEQCEALTRDGELAVAAGNRDLWPMGNAAAELAAQELGAGEVSAIYAAGRPVSSTELRGLETFVRLRDAGCFEKPGVVEAGGLRGMGDDDAKVLFLSGKATQHVVGSWLLADVEDARSKGELAFEVDFFPIPSPAGKPPALGAVKTGFLVNPRSANVKASVAFLELLLSRKYQERFAELGAISLRTDAATFKGDALSKRMLAVLAEAGDIVAPSDTGFAPQQAHAFYETVGRLLSGELGDVEAAAAALSERKARLAEKGL